MRTECYFAVMRTCNIFLVSYSFLVMRSEELVIMVIYSDAMYGPVMIQNLYEICQF
jgi:hypothetical protein